MVTRLIDIGTAANELHLRIDEIKRLVELGEVHAERGDDGEPLLLASEVAELASSFAKMSIAP